MNKTMVYGLKITGFYLIGFIIKFISPSFITAINDFLRKSESYLSSSFVNVFGFKTTSQDLSVLKCGIYNKERELLLTIIDSCNGLLIFFIYLSIITASFEPWRRILKYAFTGVAIIYTLNVIRISALTIIAIKSPEHLDFNHHYTFTVIVYGIILLLWKKFFDKNLSF
jgi:exosortase/archaeosortase family protein